MLNVYEQVERNRRRSFLIMVGFGGFVVGFVWLVGKFLNSGPEVIVIATVFSLLSSFTSYFWGDKIILALSKARPATKKEFFDFYTVAENLAIANQIPLPKLYVIKSGAMNAFATGRDPQHAVIAVTTGLLEKLERSELEAVLAHEFSHIINYDIRLMMIVSVLVGMIMIVSDWLQRATVWEKDLENEDREKNPLFVVVGLLALILAPLIAKLIQLAISRRREFLADATAVKTTRQPQALISALRKLAAQTQSLAVASPATAHLYIVNPFGKNKKVFWSKFATLFSTHPPIEARIASLQKML